MMRHAAPPTQGTLPGLTTGPAAAPLPSTEAPALPPPTAAEKAAQRAAQGHRCERCGGASKAVGKAPPPALDVVRLPSGALVAYCRSCRCSWDGAARARKGAAKRRRPLRRVGGKAGQGRLGL